MRPCFWQCFICGSDEICTHREYELVVWWLSQSQEMPITAPKTTPPTNRETSGGTELPRPGSGFRAGVTRDDALARRRS